MRKPAFCAKSKGNHAADQRLCVRYIDSRIPLLPKSGISSLLTIFCGCSSRFVSDLAGNPEDRFSGDAAHIFLCVRLATGHLTDIV